MSPEQLQGIRDDWASVDPSSKRMLLMREDVYAVLNDFDALAAELAEMKSQARHWQCAAAASSDYTRELEAVVRDVECLLTIVAPRSHTAEYLALLAKARTALGMIPKETDRDPTSEHLLKQGYRSGKATDPSSHGNASNEGGK